MLHRPLRRFRQLRAGQMGMAATRREAVETAAARRGTAEDIRPAAGVALRMSDIIEIIRIYQGSDGELTKRLYARLEPLGPAGVVAEMPRYLPTAQAVAA
jgi:hypothetical protein